MFDSDYRCGPHETVDAAVRSVAVAGHCAIVRIHHANGYAHAEVAVVDTTALYLSGARAHLEQFAGSISEPPAPRTGATWYAMVLPPAGAACLIDQHGQTRTLALGAEFTDDPAAREQIYAGLRALMAADRQAHVRAGRAFGDLAADASTVAMPGSAFDEPSRRRLPRS